MAELTRREVSGLLSELREDPEGTQNYELLCSACSILKLSAANFLPSKLASGASREEQETLLCSPFWAIQMEILCPLCLLICDAIKSSCRLEHTNNKNLICTVYMRKLSCHWDYYNGHESFRFLTVK